MCTLLFLFQKSVVLCFLYLKRMCTTVPCKHALEFLGNINIAPCLLCTCDDVWTKPIKYTVLSSLQHRPRLSCSSVAALLASRRYLCASLSRFSLTVRLRSPQLLGSPSSAPRKQMRTEVKPRWYRHLRGCLIQAKRKNRQMGTFSLYVFEFWNTINYLCCILLHFTNVVILFFILIRNPTISDRIRNI